MRRLQAVSPRTRLIVLMVTVGAAFAILAATGPLSSARVRGWVPSSGAGAALVFVLVSSALTVACFPGPLLAAASGLLFGTAEGTVVSIAAALLGASMAFTLARVVAGDAAARLGGRRVTAASEWIGRRGFLAVLYARILPGVPYTVVNYGAGLSPVKFAPFAAATLIGVAPRAFAYTALGGSLGNLASPEALIAVAVLLAEGVLGLALVWRGRRRSNIERPG